MSQFPFNPATGETVFTTFGRFGCVQGDFIPICEAIDDSNIAADCSCNFHCCICGGWCASDGRCVLCGNVCTHNCFKDCDCGCGCDCCGHHHGRHKGCNALGTLCVRKVSAVDRTPLANATYQLQNAAGAPLRTGVTNAQGELCFTNVTLGTYSLVETVPPQGYQPNPLATTVSLTEEEPQLFLELTDLPITGTVTAAALSAACNMPISGVTLALSDCNTNQVAVGTTDASGLVTFMNIPLGSYMVSATTPPPGFGPAAPQMVTVSATMPNPAAVLTFPPIIV
ncbi:MAG: hypothetical protein LBU67_03280 [Oscillospiraceae bacterium]|nr:hypothetical protein [Oscillospiraceae bacterium]